MNKTKKQIQKQFGKKPDLTKPHIRWNHRVIKDSHARQNGALYAAVIGGRKERESVRTFLVKELNRIYGPVEEDVMEGGQEFNVAAPKMNGLLLILQTPARLEFIDWDKLKKPCFKDSKLYERVTFRDYHNILAYLEKIYN